MIVLAQKRNLMSAIFRNNTLVDSKKSQKPSMSSEKGFRIEIKAIWHAATHVILNIWIQQNEAQEKLTVTKLGYCWYKLIKRLL